MNQNLKDNSYKYVRLDYAIKMNLFGGPINEARSDLIENKNDFGKIKFNVIHYSILFSPIFLANYDKSSQDIVLNSPEETPIIQNKKRNKGEILNVTHLFVDNLEKLKSKFQKFGSFVPNFNEIYRIISEKQLDPGTLFAFFLASGKYCKKDVALLLIDQMKTLLGSPKQTERLESKQVNQETIFNISHWMCIKEQSQEDYQNLLNCIPHLKKLLPSRDKMSSFNQSAESFIQYFLGIEDAIVNQIVPKKRQENCFKIDSFQKEKETIEKKLIFDASPNKIERSISHDVEFTKVAQGIKTKLVQSEITQKKSKKLKFLDKNSNNSDSTTQFTQETQISNLTTPHNFQNNPLSDMQQVGGPPTNEINNNPLVSCDMQQLDGPPVIRSNDNQQNSSHEQNDKGTNKKSTDYNTFLRKSLFLKEQKNKAQDLRKISENIDIKFKKPIEEIVKNYEKIHTSVPKVCGSVIKNHLNL